MDLLYGKKVGAINFPKNKKQIFCGGFGMTMKEFFDSPLFEREELEED